MFGPWKVARDGHLTLTLRPGESDVLTDLFAQLLDLLGPDPAEADDEDPLARMVGIGTSTTAPDDPALARLFPDGYSDDPERAAEFRRFTELGLRGRKRESAEQVLAGLSAATPQGEVEVPADEGPVWLTALTDLRLVLGSRLGVDADIEATMAGLDEDDPRWPAFAVYDWLTLLQEGLVQSLWRVEGRRGKHR